MSDALASAVRRLEGWSWPASKIVTVHDGDTITAEVSRDLGFGGRAVFRVRLRLNRINAPALHSARGRDAANYLTQLLPAGSVVDLTTLNPYKFGGPPDSPGEWMVEVHLPDGDVSDLMVSAGHAVYWSGLGPRPED